MRRFGTKPSATKSISRRFAEPNEARRLDRSTKDRHSDKTANISLDDEPLQVYRTSAKLKDRQSRKIREFKDALVASGFVTLNEQANTLGLCRSSAWSILRGNHKASGLSATTITTLLTTPMLPAAVRARILEYVEEKAAGLYGHGIVQRRRFIDRLATKGVRVKKLID